MKTKIFHITTILIAFLFGFALFFHPLSAFTQDLGRHLKTGGIIVTTHTIPKTNFFSYTYPNFPFINHHWFSEVIFYFIAHTFGLFWLLVSMATIGGLSFVIIFSQTVTTSKYNAISLFATFLLGGVLLQRLDLRPEIFSFLCTAIFVSVLYRYRDQPTKWIFLLPVLELFWVNVHIYFIIGPFLVGLFLLEKIFLSAGKYKFFADRVLPNTWPKGISIAEQEKFHTDLSALLLLILAFCLCALATLFNPNAIQGALYPFTVFSNYGYSIEENQSLFTLLNLGFSQPSFLFFFLAVLLLFFSLLLNLKKSKLVDWLLAIVFTLLGLSAVRNFSLFVFATYIPFVTNLTGTIHQLDVKKPFVKGIGLLVCLIFGAWVLTNHITADGFGYAIPSGAEPGVDFLITHHLFGPIFNNFDIGSYLEYRLFPKKKVFVDGRPEAYPASFFQNTYIPMQQDPRVFAQTDAKYHFQTIFFSYTDQTPWAQTFIKSISQNPHWSLVYVDGFSAIWVKNTPENQNRINHFALQQKTYYPSSLTITSLQDDKDLVYFFNLINWQQAELATLQKIIQQNPTNCFALRILTQNPSTQGMYRQNYLSHCQ